MKNLNRILILVSIVPLILFFQNCSRSHFEIENPPTPAPAQAQNDSPIKLDFKTKPAVLTNQKKALFEFLISAQDSVRIEQLEFNLNNQGWQAALINLETSNTLRGNNQIEVRALLKKDSSYSESIKYLWFIDDEIPLVAFTQLPNLVTSDSPVDIAFNITETTTQVASIECLFNNVVVNNCESPFHSPTLVDGIQTFKVRATDKAGNISEWASYQFEFDTLVRSVVLTAVPESLVAVQNALLSFDQSGLGTALTSYQCRLDQNAFGPCVSPVNLVHLSEGLHKFEVVGADALGNLSQTASVEWTVDLTAPSFNLILPENAVIEQGSPVDTSLITETSNSILQFDSSDANGIETVECAFDSTSAFTSCQSPIDRRSIESSGGIKNYRVRITDKVGHVTLKSIWFRATENSIPFITINFSGGIGFTGNMIVLDKNKELLPHYGYMGLGSASNLIGYTTQEFGMNWYSKSSILAGIKNYVGGSDANKVKFFAIANQSKPDTHANKLYAGSAVYAAGLKGQYLGQTGYGSNTVTGVGAQDAMGFVSSTTIISHIGYYPPMPGGIFDPANDSDFRMYFPNMEYNQAERNLPSIIYNSLNGNSGPAAINLGGYDYHIGDSALINQADYKAGELIGKIIKLALLKNKKIMINLTTDGANIAPLSDIPGAAWTNDSQDGVQMFVVVDPAASESYGHYMIGAFGTNQKVDPTSVAYNNTEKAAAIVVCNYLFLSGKKSCATETNNFLTTQEIDQIRVIGNQ